MVSQGKEPSRVGVTGTLGRLFQHLSVPVIAVLIFVFQGPKGYVLNLDGRLFNAGTSVDGLWLFRWLEHALSSPGVSVWDPPVFHPLKGALALGEPMLGNLLIYAPVKILSGNPILALNMVALGSFVLGAFAVYLLARGISGSYWAGLAAGLLFAFNPAQWYIIPGLRQGAFCWAALALYFLDRHVRSGKSRHLWGVAVAFSLQLWTSISLGGALAALLVLMLVHHLAFHGRRSGPFHARFWVNLTGSVVLAAVALLPLLVPYFGADAVSAKEMLSPRGGPLALLLPAADSVTAPGTFFRNYAWLHDMVGGGEGGLFPGLVLPILFCILFCLLIWQVLSRRRKGTYSARCTQRYRVQLSEFVDGAKRNRTSPRGPGFGEASRYLIAAPACAALAMAWPTSFGPALLLTLSVCAGLALRMVAGRLTGKPLLLGLGLAAALLAAVILDYRLSEAGGVEAETSTGSSKVYSYLQRSRGKGPLLELPAGPPADSWILGNHSLHWRPQLGGPSRWHPVQLETLLRATEECPGANCLRFLGKSPAETVVIHLERYPQEIQRSWKGADPAKIGFSAMGLIGNALIWERHRAPAKARAKDLVEKTKGPVKDMPPPLPPEPTEEEYEESELKSMDLPPEL